MYISLYPQLHSDITKQWQSAMDSRNMRSFPIVTVACTEETRNAYKNLFGKPEKITWEDNIKMNLKKPDVGV
jgi:hypothetical protein